MRLGAIDCGTNSIRLLIADVEHTVSGPRLRELERVMKIVRLGQGVDSTGRFSAEALERTFAATDDYARLLRAYGVSRIRYGATSATRDAANREVFLSGVEKILGVRPQVISGEEEAQLSFTGALSAVDDSPEPTLVVDLGGGSTEFVLGNSEGVTQSVSTDIGCVRLTERHSVSAPVSEREKAALLADTDRALEAALERVDLAAATRLVGVAGTVTTVVAQSLGFDSYDRQKINGAELGLADIQAAAAELAAMNRRQRAALGFMHEGRVDVIGAGALIWARIVERVHELTGSAVSGATASEFDILDGLALSLV